MNPEEHPLTSADAAHSTEPTTLECGCVFTPGKPAKFLPCGELHREVAMRLRRPGASWVIVR